MQKTKQKTYISVDYLSFNMMYEYTLYTTVSEQIIFNNNHE